MDNYSVTFFGVGDGAPCADRNHSSVLYKINGSQVLIDCGEPLCRSYKATGASFDAIDRILISHYHFDHFGGFFMFMQGCWLEGRKNPLPVHLPKAGIPAVKEILRCACLFDEVLPFPMTFHPQVAGEPITSGNLTITAFPTTHLSHFQHQYESQYPGNFEAFGFLLESGSLRIGHSADLGAPTDLAPLLEQPLDLLVCEVSHFKPEELFSYLKGAEIRRLVLTHVGGPLWDNLDALRIQVAKMLPDIPATFAQDQLTVDSQ